VGDWLEIIHPSGNHNVQLTHMENADAQAMSVAPGSGHTVWLPLPESAVGAFVARYVTALEDEPGVAMTRKLVAETRLGGQIPIQDKSISEAT
jgi:putative protease